MTTYLPKNNELSRIPLSLGRTVDISPSGVGMEVYQEVAVGTAIEMEIDLELPPVLTLGKVVRVDPLDNGNYLIGIKFDEEQQLLQGKIAVAEISALHQQKSALEAILKKLVETGWPWDEKGQPDKMLLSCKPGFAEAMTEAKKLLAGTARENL
jgi:hypothetical protein